ncbi:hypothetical protein PsYK624_054720 [Phanerochaete sordida]|uniref:Uncharacterized protein n=1 Tax=Phanerochaete sordida TaxID=48140 RepID=A0A9P3G557_9APHY|nr:hypothetical protein PsYK624_054720 [Phanerochaete sordida]
MSYLTWVPNQALRAELRDENVWRLSQGSTGCWARRRRPDINAACPLCVSIVRSSLDQTRSRLLSAEAYLARCKHTRGRRTTIRNPPFSY